MELVIRATVVYFFLWAVARGTGKRELTQLNAFELILLVTMGDLVQQGVTQEDMSLTGAMLSVGTIAFWIMVFSYIAFRFRGTRTAIDGLPVVIIRDGKLLENVLTFERLTDDEVMEAARHQGIADLTDVEIGVLEPDGKLSFIQRNGKQQSDDDDSLAV